MSIFRCKKCDFIKEIPRKHIDKMAKCPKCSSENRVADTVAFVQKIVSAYRQKQDQVATYGEAMGKFKREILHSRTQIEKAKKYITAQKQTHDNEILTHFETIEKLKENYSKLNGKYSQLINKIDTQKQSYKSKVDVLTKHIESLERDLEDSNSTVDNISNSEEFISSEDYSQVVDWFGKKNMKIKIDKDSMDTGGFFDEVAIMLGNNFNILESVLVQMRYVQRKGFDTVKISLDNKNKEDIAIIKSFCQEIYDYSFVSRYYYDKKKNAVYLEIQKAIKIVNFFNGMWMEWYVYMMLLDFFKRRNISNTMVRGLHVNYANKDSNELDIFFIANDIPVCIECKSGEFRRDIDKYIKLKRRLVLKKEQFIICAIGMNGMQTDGLTNTYDITFANQNNLLQYIEKLLIDTENVIPLSRL